MNFEIVSGKPEGHEWIFKPKITRPQVEWFLVWKFTPARVVFQRLSQNSRVAVIYLVYTTSEFSGLFQKCTLTDQWELSICKLNSHWSSRSEFSETLNLKIHSEEWIYGLFLKIHSEEWIYGFKNHCCNKTSSGQWVYWQFLPVIFLLVSGVKSHKICSFPCHLRAGLYIFFPHLCTNEVE